MDSLNNRIKSLHHVLRSSDIKSLTSPISGLLLNERMFQSPLNELMDSQKKLRNFANPLAELRLNSAYYKMEKMFNMSKLMVNSDLIHAFARIDGISGMLNTAQYFHYPKWDDVDFETHADYKEENNTSPIILLNDIARVQDIIKSVYRDNKELYKVHSRDFERLIAELLRDKNFHVELTKETRDGGFDIIALQDLCGFKNKYLVECKRYSENNPVGIGIVRELMTVINEQQANKGIIFTSSYFSKEVYKAKETKYPYTLDLQNGLDVLSWIGDYMTKKKL